MSSSVNQGSTWGQPAPGVNLHRPTGGGEVAAGDEVEITRVLRHVAAQVEFESKV
jgi:hypothetical protein